MGEQIRKPLTCEKLGELAKMAEEANKISAWEEHIWFPICRTWTKITDIPREIKWFIQRGRRGYADCDTWSLDAYLCKWLPIAIRELKDRSLGYPSFICGHKVGSGKCTSECDEKGSKRWKSILEDMAQGFEAGSVFEEDYFIDDKGKFEREKYKALQKKFDKGMLLFKKYFFNLWD